MMLMKSVTRIRCNPSALLVFMFASITSPTIGLKIIILKVTFEYIWTLKMC